MHFVAAVSQLEAELRSYDSATAIGGITGDSDFHWDPVTDICFPVPIANQSIGWPVCAPDSAARHKKAAKSARRSGRLPENL
jgi:hypothetical protein